MQFLKHNQLCAFFGQSHYAVGRAAHVVVAVGRVVLLDYACFHILFRSYRSYRELKKLKTNALMVIYFEL